MKAIMMIITMMTITIIIVTETLTLPKHILELTPEEKRNFLDSIDVVLSDIDGVVTNTHNIIPNVGKGFQHLRNAGKKVKFLSNNSERPLQFYAELFKNTGFDYDPNDIISPAKSVTEFLKSIKFNGLIYIIGSENFKSILRKEGFHIIDKPDIIANATEKDIVTAAKSKEPVGAVVIDTDFDTSYLKLITANSYLRNPGCLLIVGLTDLEFPIGDGQNIMGTGVFGKLIAAVNNREPITLGKPGKDLAQLVIKRLNIRNTKRVLMIGDMLEQDIGFGKVADFQTLVVLSGGSKFEDLKKASNKHILPDYYAESVGDFVEFMKDLQK